LSIPNVFPSSSQCVPHVLNVFCKMFPIALHFSLSHIVWPRGSSSIYINPIGRRWYRQVQSITKHAISWEGGKHI
jgi:hypothetical protein